MHLVAEWAVVDETGADFPKIGMRQVEVAKRTVAIKNAFAAIHDDVAHGYSPIS